MIEFPAKFTESVSAQWQHAFVAGFVSVHFAPWLSILFLHEIWVTKMSFQLSCAANWLCICPLGGNE
jgi:hypothetical protein